MKREQDARVKRHIKAGDPVMVIAGGNKDKRPLKGKVGKVLRFAGQNGDRVIVEGLNLFTRHQRATDTENRGGRLQKEGSIHVSNVMYYAEKIKRPVRVKHTTLQDGRKVRGYINPETKEFEQIDV